MDAPTASCYMHTSTQSSKREKPDCELRISV